MRFTLLDSVPEGPISDVVLEQTKARGEVRRHDLRDTRFAPCQGCFECWTDHPGRCRATDGSNTVMADIVGADALVWVARVRFGCWDAVAKSALDKSIGLLSPFFVQRHGETHHARRYGHLPPWVVIAVVARDTPTAEREAFSRLVQRNVISFSGAEPFVGFVEEGATLEQIRAVVRNGLNHATVQRSADFPDLGTFEDPRRSPVPKRHAGPKHATLWVGSAKPRGTSTSEALGGALLRRLEAAGWSTEVVHVASTVKLGKHEAQGLEQACRRADLVILAAPIYIDTLPALVLAGLDALAQSHWGDQAPCFLPLLQCGFPEVAHTTSAFETLHRWSLEVNWAWTGHLALGGGEALAGADFEHHPALGAAQRTALSEVANELDGGKPVSEDATKRFGEPMVGPMIYRLVGSVGWVMRAARGGHLMDLWNRPF